jgi:hypothetical protein
MVAVSYVEAVMSLEGRGQRAVQANRRNSWMMALYAAMVALNAVLLVLDLLIGDSTWWNVALRVLGIALFGFALNRERKKPKAGPVST